MNVCIKETRDGDGEKGLLLLRVFGNTSPNVPCMVENRQEGGKREAKKLCRVVVHRIDFRIVYMVLFWKILLFPCILSVLLVFCCFIFY